MTDTPHAEAGGSTATRSLNHFSMWVPTADYRALDATKALKVRKRWTRALDGVARAVHHYSTFPARTADEVLVWCAEPVSDDLAPARFFDAFASAVRPFRRWITPVDVLWGFTRASEYSRARSKQEIDPYAPKSRPYLVVYPFTKTAAWYQLDAEARQAMMNEHIRIGKSHADVSQLLVYSVGLQDQEFVVVYETADLPGFSALVAELRRTAARPYTLSDTPVRTAIHRSADDPGNLWP
ncbi:MAG TPA: chlorite dismutase family protein [Longimicrobiales bacterium]|nr:chlorite dismutase family protein [Longimicrobiales bacterium]